VYRVLAGAFVQSLSENQMALLMIQYYFIEIDFKVLGLTFRNQDATANMATIYNPRAS
jgi:hypothetical protein